ncbi:MAG TPA: cupin domain-containing protein [Actinomycetota bacterium]|nr:cupin domain-containing protein [Actinomycetota bacterium]
MASYMKKSFDTPDEVRTFAHGKLDVVSLGSHVIARTSFEPGWKWSEDIKPKVGTDSCQKHHVGYATEGRLSVVTDDGDEFEIQAGDVYEVQPGHDAWVVGNDNFVGLEFEGKTAEEFSKK